MVRMPCWYVKWSESQIAAGGTYAGARTHSCAEDVHEVQADQACSGLLSLQILLRWPAELLQGLPWGWFNDLLEPCQLVHSDYINAHHQACKNESRARHAQLAAAGGVGVGRGRSGGMKRTASGLAVADHNMLDLHLQAPSDLQYGGFASSASMLSPVTWCMCLCLPAGTCTCHHPLRVAGHVQMELPQGSALGDVGCWTAAVSDSAEQPHVSMRPVQTPAMKVCRMCTLEKPASDYKRARSHDGLMHICTLCLQVISSPLTLSIGDKPETQVVHTLPVHLHMLAMPTANSLLVAESARA